MLTKIIASIFQLFFEGGNLTFFVVAAIMHFIVHQNISVAIIALTIINVTARYVCNAARFAVLNSKTVTSFEKVCFVIANINSRSVMILSFLLVNFISLKNIG